MESNTPMPESKADMEDYIKELQKKNEELQVMLKQQRGNVTSVDAKQSSCCTLF
jgi:hypothetical protein